MLEQLGDIAVRLSRSPLGIIAFAFVFVYAIAGLLTWRANFEGDERRILVWFLVGFPVLVLLLFFRLVTNHHDKLYAPSDFANDDSFLRVLEQRIRTSDAFQDLEVRTSEIQAQIDAQPLYRYTKLSEEGKQLSLTVYTKGEVDLSAFFEKRNLDKSKVDAQIKILTAEYGWIQRNDSILRLTEKGRDEMDTFADLAYGRMK